MKDPIISVLEAVEQIRVQWCNEVTNLNGLVVKYRQAAVGYFESLEAAHAAIWGLVCALTEARADAKSARDGRNRLRRSNDRVREVLGAKPGESPVDAVNRFALRHNDVVGRVAELERLRVELKNLHAAANLDLRASENKRIAETQAIRAGWAEDREELLQRNRVVVDERDAALARVAELECAIDLEWSPYVRRAAEVKS